MLQNGDLIGHTFAPVIKRVLAIQSHGRVYMVSRLKGNKAELRPDYKEMISLPCIETTSWFRFSEDHTGSKFASTTSI